MKYTPRQPAEGINVSNTHPLVEAGTLLIGVAAAFLVATLLVVYLVDILLRFISPETETRWFSGWMPEDVVLASSLNDEQQRADALLQRMAGHWPDSSYRFRLRIDDSATPNALALPGGLIIVTRGLMQELDSENELAFVLGHELGHYRNRDHIRQLGRATVLGLLYTVVTQGGSGSFGFGISDLALRGFGRDQERAADRFGLSLVQAEYGHINEATRFFERIDETRGNVGALAGYLDTHPQPGERMRDLRDYARQQGWPAQGPLTPWPTTDTESSP